MNLTPWSLMGCGWLVGPWCKVGFAEVECSRRFVGNVLLPEPQKDFEKDVFGQTSSLSARVAADVGFLRATVGIWQPLVS